MPEYQTVVRNRQDPKRAFEIWWGIAGVNGLGPLEISEFL
jgi:hypothetical protein